MRILCTGDRLWDDVSLIKNVLSKESHEDTVIIHGGARGADTICGHIGNALDFIVLRFDADWKKFGRAAGPIRNRQMLDEGRPQIVYAFHDALHLSKGTLDMVRQSRKRGLTVRLFSHEHPEGQLIEGEMIPQRHVDAFRS